MKMNYFKKGAGEDPSPALTKVGAITNPPFLSPQLLFISKMPGESAQVASAPTGHSLALPEPRSVAAAIFLKLWGPH